MEVGWAMESSNFYLAAEEYWVSENLFGTIIFLSLRLPHLSFSLSLSFSYPLSLCPLLFLFKKIIIIIPIIIKSWGCVILILCRKN